MNTELLNPLLQEGTRRLRDAGAETPGRTARWLLEDLLDLSRTTFLLEPERPVSPDAAEAYRTRVARRASGEPLQHILGYASFFGLRIEVSPDVLIPRPETEEVAAHALDVIAAVDAPRILDVGTGSGCIALALAHERPDANVTACDVSAEALAVARRNSKRLALPVRWIEADVLADDVPARVPEALDLLISNPPYIPDDEAEALPAVVRDHDPHVALFSGDDPLRFYRALAHHGAAIVAPAGVLVVETHAHYAHDVAACLEDAGWHDVTVTTDLGEQPRIVTGHRAGDAGQPPASIENPKNDKSNSASPRRADACASSRRNDP